MSAVLPLIFLLLTLVLFYANQSLHRRHPHFLLTPAICTSAILIAILALTSTPFTTYFGETQWLSWLLGPATVAFALPLYQERKLIRKHWLALSLGSLAGIAASLLATVLLDHLLGLHGSMARSLLARSVSTPFALEASRHMGGSSQLTGVFVIITGLFGLLLGRPLLQLLPLRMRIARGAPYGAAAHGFGLSVANKVGGEEGAVASLTMIFSGIVTVLLSPLLGPLLGRLLG
ncbi:MULTISPECIES: LrgB family protein [unclassified Janthinobacterium]|uniref:LrgB family protein n=1 Tax=unclassified Janthinobacterium TaxID=2610881 RepID=UPI0016192C35|nr:MULTISPECIES: LrgB family protein [unclassified Janthinobacterium]MBB5606302.1 putative effector of murein hydrolase [Janthinobacterium sp. S3T4]MBB5611826.1 putative effector of murein hydrolase [Janthinobacterium sp. S3M3]